MERAAVSQMYFSALSTPEKRIILHRFRPMFTGFFAKSFDLAHFFVARFRADVLHWRQLKEEWMKRTYDEMLPTLRVKREIKRRMARIAKKHYRDNFSEMRRVWIEAGIAKHDKEA